MKTKSFFVNFATNDIIKTRQFYTNLGLELVKDFSDETNNCFKVTDSLYLMTMNHERFREFTNKTLIDSHQSKEVLLSIEVESIKEVDNISTKAIKLGGSASEPIDPGYMYYRVITDLDGHHIEIFAWKH